MKKICSKCNIEKEVQDFNKRTNSKDGYDPRCRTCTKERDVLRYTKNPKLFKERAKVKNTFIRDRNRQFLIEYLIDKSCIDCGETDAVVLEFDHIEPSTKIDCISEMIPRSSIENIKTELNKCEIRCANCHRRKTAKQFGWKRKHLELC
jgi:hypothetical protein